MPRIHRFEVSILSYENGFRPEKVKSFKWTRGNMILEEVYKKLCCEWNFGYIPFGDFTEMVVYCRDGGNIIFDIDKNTSVEVRHWSYHRKK